MHWKVLRFFVGMVLYLRTLLPAKASAPRLLRAGRFPRLSRRSAGFPQPMEPCMMPAQPTLDEILAGYGRERDNLIPLLQEVQERFQYLAPEAVQRVADHLDLSENDVYGVATFYAQFRFVPPGLHHVKVCQGTACHVRGSGMIMDSISRTIGIEPGQTSTDGKFSLERVACFGSCALAPVVVLDDKVFGRMTSAKTKKLIEDKE